MPLSMCPDSKLSSPLRLGNKILFCRRITDTLRENGLRTICFYRDDLIIPKRDRRGARKFSAMRVPLNITMTVACTYQQIEHSTKFKPTVTTTQQII